MREREESELSSPLHHNRSNFFCEETRGEREERWRGSHLHLEKEIGS